MEKGLKFWVKNSGKNFHEWHHGYCLRLIINSEAGAGNHLTEVARITNQHLYNKILYIFDLI